MIQGDLMDAARYPNTNPLLQEDMTMLELKFDQDGFCCGNEEGADLPAHADQTDSN